MLSAILPSNSTPWEKAVADGIDETSLLVPFIHRLRSAKLVNPPPTFVPFLVHEYGLGELTPYVPNLYDLVRYGLRWQRLRGTPEAVRMGLDWVGLTASLEEASWKRQFWNAFQLHFTTLPLTDDPDLDRIENIVSLSVPIRSKLRRATFGYDVRAIVTDGARLDCRRLDGDSGTRLNSGTVLWSFGRTTEVDHLLTAEEGERLGIWLEPIQGDSPKWADLTFPWSSAGFPWGASAGIARAVALASWFVTRSLYQALRDASGEVIGYRRARVVHRVRPQVGGPFRFGGSTFAASGSGTQLFIEALTDFDDNHYATAKTTSLLVGATPAPKVPPGKLWLSPGQLLGGVEIATTPIDLTLRPTVRERFKTMLRF